MREVREAEWKKVNDMIDKTEDMCHRRHQELLRKMDRCRQETDQNRPVL